MAYLYAICDAGALSGLEGELRDEALWAVEAAGLAAIAGEPAGDLVKPSEEDLWEHERIVEVLMSHCELLPVRYGTVVADDAELGAVLRERAGELAAALRRVRGRVELGVRARFSASVELSPRGEAPAGAPGAAYMNRLLAVRRLAEELRARIDGDLSAFASESATRTLPSAGQPMSGAYLVDNDGVERFRRRVLELDDEIQEAELACTGPWPPYSFTAAEGR